MNILPEAKDPRPFVAVVTVTYNSAGVLSDFMESLIEQQDCLVRLYVVDNNSHDSTLEMLSSYKSRVDVSLIRNEKNLGVAAANNQGIRAALQDKADWILLLNNDTIIPQAAISNLARIASSHGLDILSPSIHATEPENTIWFDGGLIYPHRGMKVVHERMGKPVSEVQNGLRVTPYASTCCLLVRPSVFASIGGMDTDYFVYFDDVDFCVRAANAGFNYWLSSDVYIIHKASSLTGGFLGPFTLRWLTRNWVLVTRKHLAMPARIGAYAYMQAWMAGRLLFGRDKPLHFVRRQRAFYEGLLAPISGKGASLEGTEYLGPNSPLLQIVRGEEAVAKVK